MPVPDTTEAARLARLAARDAAPPAPATTPEASLLARLDEINAVIASGADSVSYADKSTHFRSLADLMRIRDGLLRQLGLVTRARRTVAAFHSGFTGGFSRGFY